MKRSQYSGALPIQPLAAAFPGDLLNSVGSSQDAPRIHLALRLLL
jgi:hypothetical protein